ncbi:hypothetical protein ACIOHC_40700 [Streptomyces sp. NPDC088252]|uniref:hypothetical protein n=1 Tax=Streptomyces sp. NPDC088252 TaxID=3365845 RepID=UPI003827E85B
MSDDLQNGGARKSAIAGRWLTDPGWLVNTDPEQVLAALGGAAGREEVLAAAVYRASAYLHQDAGAGMRRQLLALEAARYGERELAARIVAAPVEGEPAARWGVDWATGGMLSHQLRHTLTGHTDVVYAVPTAVVEGRPVTVTGSWDRMVRVWDLAAGQPIGDPLTGHTGWVLAVATAVVNGRPIAVTGSFDETVRVWDLAAANPLVIP